MGGGGAAQHHCLQLVVVCVCVGYFGFGFLSLLLSIRARNQSRLGETFVCFAHHSDRFPFVYVTYVNVWLYQRAPHCVFACV